jgi:transposase
MTSADALVNIKLTQIVRQRTACLALLSIPGIGLMTATAMVTATSGSVAHFKDARHFASWFGFTPKEYLSGNTRYIGHISKRGDSYLRMLLTHHIPCYERRVSASVLVGIWMNYVAGY